MEQAIKIIQGQGAAVEPLIAQLCARAKLHLPELVSSVEALISDLRGRGVAALLDYTERFDGVRLCPENLELSAAEIDAACAALDADLLESIRLAAENIRRFHRLQMEQEKDLRWDDGQGRRLALLRRPLRRVGIYVPGGTAPLPSSVLMNAIPAKVAAVGELVMCTPPRRDGSVDPVILAAARLAGVDRLFRVGGAQAIAALALGCGPLPAVDKICGPGNIYVNTAKRLLYGEVDIDMFAGPSEIVVVADAGANPRFVARDLMSQAEHDRLASAVLLCDSEPLARAVQREISALLPQSPRREILAASLADYGAIVVLPELKEAMDFSNRLAPEHLELCVAEERLAELLPLVQNAGAIFMGYHSPEPLGDYWAGANHVLPTSGTARFFSPLNCGDFMKKMSLIHYSEAALREDGERIVRLAEAEGLGCHAASVAVRLENGGATVVAGLESGEEKLTP